MTPSSESYRLIPLTQGQSAKVSPEDYDWLMQWKWAAHRTSNTYYAERGKRPNGKMVMFKMHREILGLTRENPLHVDHINGDGLDNRRCNIRPATPTENKRNRKLISANNSSGFKGVYWVPCRSKWRAGITVDKKFISLGMYTTAEEAYAAYCTAARKYHGEFARMA